jgi:membrane dipeptidase
MLIDAHLDLAYAALRFGRDLQAPLSDVRAAETGRRASPNGIATVTLPELRRGGVALVFGSLFALPAHANRTLPDNKRLVYADADGAHAACMAQLDYYRRLADTVPWIRLVGSAADLAEVEASQENPEPLLGIVPLMEGADAIRHPEELEMWVDAGLRLIGPAWDDTRYAPGAWRGGGGFTDDGHALLEIMADYGLALDITHLSEKASFEALTRYEGPVVATHCNARALVPGERQLNDEQLRALGERDGVSGIVLCNRFLKKGWGKGDHREQVTLDDVIAHIDHVCQVLGSARHVGFGTDLDGGFGRQEIPGPLDSCADLGQVTAALLARGYTEADVGAIGGGNWLRILQQLLS